MVKGMVMSMRFTMIMNMIAVIVIEIVNRIFIMIVTGMCMSMVGSVTVLCL